MIYIFIWHIHLYVCLYLFIFVHTHMCVLHVCASVDIHMCFNTSTHICMYTYMWHLCQAPYQRKILTACNCMYCMSDLLCVCDFMCCFTTLLYLLCVSIHKKTRVVRNFMYCISDLLCVCDFMCCFTTLHYLLCVSIHKKTRVVWNFMYCISDLLCVCDFLCCFTTLHYLLRVRWRDTFARLWLQVEAVMSHERKTNRIFCLANAFWFTPWRREIEPFQIRRAPHNPIFFFRFIPLFPPSLIVTFPPRTTVCLCVREWN